MNSPNILFLMTDQLRADAVGPQAWTRTPNLNRIAAEGVTFTAAVTNSPVCVPARVSLATGLYPHNTGVWRNCDYDMPAATPTWMQAIRDSGYRTSLFGKTHLHRHAGDLRDRENLLRAYGLDDIDEIGGPRASVHVGSHMTDRWKQLGLLQSYQEDYAERFGNRPWVARPSTLPLEEYADVYVARQASAYLEAYDRPQPWFCWVSFGGPHEPWDAPEPYASMYQPGGMPKPIPPCLDHEKIDGNLGAMLRDRPEMSAAEIAALRANYAGNVTLIDEQIGKILDVIAARGELDNTLIVFTSDHGEMNGDHGLIYKENFLSASVRVPLLIRPAPAQGELPRGVVCDAPIELFDVGPTMAEAAGGGLKYSQFGRSLLPLLAEPDGQHRRFVVSELSGEIMIMDRRWKLVFNCGGRPCLLFDQQEDPDETVNRVDDPDCSRLVETLREQLFQHLLQTQSMRC
jgi:arylsulfatase